MQGLNHSCICASCQGTTFCFQLLQQPQHLSHLLQLFPNSSHSPQVHSTPLLLIPRSLHWCPIRPELLQTPPLLYSVEPPTDRPPHGIHRNSRDLTRTWWNKLGQAFLSRPFHLLSFLFVFIISPIIPIIFKLSAVRGYSALLRWPQTSGRRSPTVTYGHGPFLAALETWWIKLGVRSIKTLFA